MEVDPPVVVPAPFGRATTSVLRLLVALLVLVVAFSSSTSVAEAQDGVAAINPESGPAVEAVGDIAAGHVGSETRLFDDGVSGCCVAPQSALPCNSFVPGTAVLMADGSTKAIEDIEFGDLVWAADPETGEEGPREVTRLITGHGDKTLIDIEIDGETVTATDHHPIWVRNQGEWVDAEDLQPGRLPPRRTRRHPPRRQHRHAPRHRPDRPQPHRRRPPHLLRPRRRRRHPYAWPGNLISGCWRSRPGRASRRPHERQTGVGDRPLLALLGLQELVPELVRDSSGGDVRLVHVDLDSLNVSQDVERCDKTDIDAMSRRRASTTVPANSALSADLTRSAIATRSVAIARAFGFSWSIIGSLLWSMDLPRSKGAWLRFVGWLPPLCLWSCRSRSLRWMREKRCVQRICRSSQDLPLQPTR